MQLRRTGRTWKRCSCQPACHGENRSRRAGKNAGLKTGTTAARVGARRDYDLAQVTPVVEFVGVFDPAVADVGAVVHVGNENIFDAGIDLGLSLFHRGSGADDDPRLVCYEEKGSTMLQKIEKWREESR